MQLTIQLHDCSGQPQTEEIRTLIRKVSGDGLLWTYKNLLSCNLKQHSRCAVKWVFFSVAISQLNSKSPPFTKAFFIMWCWWTPCQETSQTCLLSEDSFLLKIFLVRKLRIFSFLSKWFCPAHLFMDINVFAFPYVVGLLVWFGLVFSFSHSSPLLPLCPFFWFVSGGDSMGKAKDSPFCGKKKKKSAWDSIYHKYVAIFLLKMDIFQLLCLSKQAIKNHAIWSTNPNTLVVRYFPTPLRVTVHTNKYISLTEAAGEISDVFSCLWLLPNPHTNSCSRLKSS